MRIDKIIALSITITGIILPVFSQKSENPNIILIMADDMGYSDVGCYGGEIKTPNIDRLANNGIRYTQFYNAARCCPTRASLLTGLYPHQTGVGWMTFANLGTPQYQGELNFQCLTIAEVLKTSGYATYMAGKWHVARNYDEGQTADKHNWPLQRGFDKFFGTISGGGSYFKPHNLISGNNVIQSGQSFYYTDAISDTIVSYIREHNKKKEKKPFFMYVAYTAPHWPLHALNKDIALYKGVYDKGWDEIRAERYERMKKLGVIPENTLYSERQEDAAAWNSIPKRLQPELAHRMEVYAAQIHNMDQGIGRIITELEKNGQLENTIIMFLSDNGACAEMVSNAKKTGEIGESDDSFESYGLAWANASNSPFRMFKKWTHEGGVATPFIVHWPKGIQTEYRGKFYHKPGHITDIMATLVDITKTDYHKIMKRNPEILPLEGQSLLSTFQLHDNNRKPIFWEHEANIGMRDGQWKLVAEKMQGNEPDTRKLELYNLEADRSETSDVAAQYPEIVKKMYDEWIGWANRIKVFPLDARSYEERVKER